eukprot:gene637-1306_t
MTAATSFSCVDYIAFKFGCQSISSRDYTDNYNKPGAGVGGSQTNLYGRRYKNVNWGIDRRFMIDDIKNFDEAKSSLNNLSRCWNNEKTCAIATSESDSTTTTVAATNNNNVVINNGGTEENKFVVRAITQQTKKDDNDHDNGAEEKHGKTQSTISKFRQQKGRNEPKLKEITNRFTSTQIMAVEQEDLYCSDSEHELLQIYGNRDDDKIKEQSNGNRQTISRKRSLTEEYDCEQIKNVAKRQRPSIDLLIMQQYRKDTKSNTSITKDTHFIPLIESNNDDNA